MALVKLPWVGAKHLVFPVHRREGVSGEGGGEEGGGERRGGRGGGGRGGGGRGEERGEGRRESVALLFLSLDMLERIICS